MEVSGGAKVRIAAGTPTARLLQDIMQEGGVGVVETFYTIPTIHVLRQELLTAYFIKFA